MRSPWRRPISATSNVFFESMQTLREHRYEFLCEKENEAPRKIGVAPTSVTGAIKERRSEAPLRFDTCYLCIGWSRVLPRKTGLQSGLHQCLHQPGKYTCPGENQLAEKAASWAGFRQSRRSAQCGRMRTELLSKRKRKAFILSEECKNSRFVDPVRRWK